MDLEQIEEAVIDPALVEDDEKAALWLYAQALRERPTIARDLSLVKF